MYTFILVESELETVPEPMWTESRIRTRARQRGREPKGMLLDQAQDHESLKVLDDGDRRGRPDLAHLFLLLIQDSPLTKMGLTRVLIHTRNDELIRVMPETRMVRNQEKFYRLMEDLFRQGHVPRHPRLFTVEKEWPLARVLAEEAKGTKVLLDEKGEPGHASHFAGLEGNVTVCMGGFPKGKFTQAKPEMFDHLVSLNPEQLSVWSALVPVLAGFEERSATATPATAE